MPGRTTAPPFPQDVPTHPLIILDYTLLQAGNPSEIEKLWKAATELGFWYLGNHGINEEVNRMFDVYGETLDLPLEEKMRFEQGDSGNSYGYKARGKIITDKTGTLDSSEFFNVAQDDALSWPEVTYRTYPEPIHENMEEVIRPFVRKSVAVCATFLRIFEHKLGLPHGELLKRHSPHQLNGGEARCVRTPANADSAGIGAHTDFGSLSLVHNRLGGLQVMPPNTSMWYYIKPLPGHAVCNIGDTLSLFSGGILRSNVHRVMPPPGEQSRFPRYSISYFCRPGNDVFLRALREQSRYIEAAVAKAPAEQYDIGVTALQWTSRRIRNLRLKSRAGWLASQGTEHEGVKG
ncbi:Clavaminate synthase-like protein [Panus rudis PR-1116 ss-1]|nr:Clavaminate synthase-like protein [Panus rudis PR-1116 ss-1]